MGDSDTDGLRAQVDNLRSGIRQIAHDLAGPLGVLRMAAYYLQVGQLDEQKREHYHRLIGETVGKAEGHLKRLRTLSDHPMSDVRAPAPPDEQP